MRACWTFPLASAALFFFPCAALSAESGKAVVQAGALYQHEDFSFTDDGMSGTALAGLALPGRFLSVFFSQETVRRFLKTETQSALAGRWGPSPRQWGLLEFSYSPRGKTDTPKVLPQWSPTAGWGFLPWKRLVLQGTYKFADYDAANSHAFAVSSEWYPFPRFCLSARAAQVGTDFPGTSAWVWNTAYSFQPALDLAPEKITLLFLYARSREPFEAGAPGETRSFIAHVFHGGLVVRAGKWNARAGWEYEDRSNATAVRRSNLSIGRSW